MKPTLHSYRGFVFRIEFDPNDPAYIVDYPDIPDIITNGPTLSLAFDHACEALDLYLEASTSSANPSPSLAID